MPDPINDAKELSGTGIEPRAIEFSPEHDYLVVFCNRDVSQTQALAVRETLSQMGIKTCVALVPDVNNVRVFELFRKDAPLSSKEEGELG